MDIGGHDMQDDVNVQDEAKKALHEALRDSMGWTFKDDKWTVGNLSSGREITCVCDGDDIVVSYNDQKDIAVSARGPDLMQALLNFRVALANGFNVSSEKNLEGKVEASVPTMR